MEKELIEFLIEAKKQTYANASAKKRKIIKNWFT